MEFKTLSCTCEMQVHGHRMIQGGSPKSPIDYGGPLDSPTWHNPVEVREINSVYEFVPI